MDKPKIALSAYQFNNPAIKELLKQCEFIFTTNVQARDPLWAEYGGRLYVSFPIQLNQRTITSGAGFQATTMSMFET